MENLDVLRRWKKQKKTMARMMMMTTTTTKEPLKNVLISGECVCVLVFSIFGFLSLCAFSLNHFSMSAYAIHSIILENVYGKKKLPLFWVFLLWNSFSRARTVKFFFCSFCCGLLGRAEKPPPPLLTQKTQALVKYIVWDFQPICYVTYIHHVLRIHFSLYMQYGFGNGKSKKYDIGLSSQPPHPPATQSLT